MFSLCHRTLNVDLGLHSCESAVRQAGTLGQNQTCTEADRPRVKSGVNGEGAFRKMLNVAVDLLEVVLPECPTLYCINSTQLCSG